MKRKEWDPKAEDMRTIVPIHNAVNERAWKEIKEWESGRGSEKYSNFSVLPSVRLTTDSPDVAGRSSFLSLGTRES